MSLWLASLGFLVQTRLALSLLVFLPSPPMFWDYRCGSFFSVFTAGFEPAYHLPRIYQELALSLL